MVELNIINSELLKHAMLISGVKDQFEVLRETIKLFIDIAYQKKLCQLRGKVKWDGNLEELRENRNDIG